MAAVTDSSIVRCSLDSNDEEYDVLQTDPENNQILVALTDEEEVGGYLDGFWGDIDDFEVKVMRQHGSGHGTYENFESIDHIS